MIIKEFKDNTISDIIKELVNLGVFSLRYGNYKNNNSIKYLLCIGDSYIFMGENGNVILESNNRDDFNCIDIVRFIE